MGRILTIDYCSRTIGYCLPYCFLEVFVGGQGFDGGVQSRVGEDPPSPPTRENPGTIGSSLFRTKFGPSLGCQDLLSFVKVIWPLGREQN